MFITQGKLSLLGENGIWIAKAFLYSNNHWGIIKFSLPLSDLSIIKHTNLLENLAAVYLLTICLISMSKLEAIKKTFTIYTK